MARGPKAGPFDRRWHREPVRHDAGPDLPVRTHALRWLLDSRVSSTGTPLAPVCGSVDVIVSTSCVPDGALMLTCCENRPFPSATTVALAGGALVPAGAENRPDQAPDGVRASLARADLDGDARARRGPAGHDELLADRRTVRGPHVEDLTGACDDVPDVKAQRAAERAAVGIHPGYANAVSARVRAEFGTKRKPRGDRVDSFVMSVASSMTRIEFGSAMPPANVAPMVGRRVATVAPRPGCSLLSRSPRRLRRLRPEPA